MIHLIMDEFWRNSKRTSRRIAMARVSGRIYVVHGLKQSWRRVGVADINGIQSVH